MRLSIRNKAIGALLLTGVLGGVSPLLMKIALKEFTTSEIVFIRFVIACLFITPLFIHYAKVEHFKKIAFTLPANILFCCNIFLFIIGLQYTTSIVSQLFYLLAPVIVSIVEYLLFRVKISVRRIVSMSICFGGSALLILRSLGGTQLIHSIGTAKGNIIVIGAVISWALYAVYTKRISKRAEPSFILTTNLLVTLMVSILFLVVSHASLVAVGGKFVHSSTPSIMSIMALAIVNAVLFFFLFQWSIKYVSAFIVSSTAYLSPLATALFAIPFFGEQISSVLLISAASIFVGSYLILTEKK